jgi:hypothetical protein
LILISFVAGTGMGLAFYIGARFGAFVFREPVPSEFGLFIFTFSWGWLCCPLSFLLGVKRIPRFLRLISGSTLKKLPRPQLGYERRVTSLIPEDELCALVMQLASSANSRTKVVPGTLRVRVKPVDNRGLVHPYALYEVSVETLGQRLVVLRVRSLALLARVFDVPVDMYAAQILVTLLRRLAERRAIAVDFEQGTFEGFKEVGLYGWVPRGWLGRQ